jgi:regulator of sirC expression with transglutaminase-like and TPR domain
MKEAEEPFKRAYQLGGKRIPDVHMFLAQIYSNSKRYKEAADELELFLNEAPDARDSQNIRALIAQLRAKAK